MNNYYNMTAKMIQKIKANKDYPLFCAFHNDDYILRHDCSKDISLRERKETRVYRMHNPSQKEIVVYHIDGGVITDNEVKKCDYGIYTVDDFLYLIELKGADLETALEQINSTINIIVKDKQITVTKLNARIVLSKVRVPDYLSTKEKQLKQLLKKNYGDGDYIKKCNLLEDTI